MHGGEDPLPMPFNETVKLYNIVSLHDSFRNELVELIMHWLDIDMVVDSNLGRHELSFFFAKISFDPMDGKGKKP